MRAISIIIAGLCCIIGGFSFYILTGFILTLYPLLFVNWRFLVYPAMCGVYIILAFTPIVLIFKSRKYEHPQFYFVWTILLGIMVITFFCLNIGKVFSN
jgi:hypothetical protein